MPESRDSGASSYENTLFMVNLRPELWANVPVVINFSCRELGDHFPIFRILLPSDVHFSLTFENFRKNSEEIKSVVLQSPKHVGSI